MNEEKKKNINIWDKVAANFGKIGPEYWSDFGERLVGFSNINSSARVLDIGMGRGASLFPAINIVGKYGCIIGIDNSELMINETYKDIIYRNICNAKVINMDAQHLDFEEEFFDNVICGFGFGYLLLSDTKLNDILRVLKNGGQAGFSIWGVQEDQKWLTEIITKYIPSDIQNRNNTKSDIPKFDNVNDIKKILWDSGFHDIKVHEEDSDVIYKNKEEWWQEMWTNAVRNIFEQIEELGSTVFKEFKLEIFNGFEKFSKVDGFHINMPVIYAFGEK